MLFRSIEHMARVLRVEPEHRFIWATYSRALIQQTLQRLQDYGPLFAGTTNAMWLDGSFDQQDFDEVQIFFMTRERLKNELGVASDKRFAAPLRDRILEKRPTTLIYDECHQLGATQLQKFWGQLHEKVLEGRTGRTHRWRVIGLSATPIPTRVEAHRLLQDYVFKPRQDVPGVPNDWGVHILHKTTLEELLARGILCRVNTALDRTGHFDLPTDLLKRVITERRLSKPPKTADRAEWSRYCTTFNAKVMTHPKVLEFFADRLEIGRAHV